MLFFALPQPKHRDKREFAIRFDVSILLFRPVN